LAAATLDETPGSWFVMIGQNRQAAFQRTKADHDYGGINTLLEENTELTRTTRRPGAADGDPRPPPGEARRHPGSAHELGRTGDGLDPVRRHRPARHLRGGSAVDGPA
jgi:hypothetical protein